MSGRPHQGVVVLWLCLALAFSASAWWKDFHNFHSFKVFPSAMTKYLASISTSFMRDRTDYLTLT